MDYSQYQNAMAGQVLPLAWLDLDALEQNMQNILQQVGETPVRVVSKSLRSVEVIKRILAYSPRFQGVMCFHPSEAAYLCDQGLDDILVAYPNMQPQAIARVCAQTAMGKQVALMVDDEAQLELIACEAKKAGVIQPLCMDIDMSTAFPTLYFGVRRSPINSVAKAVQLYRSIKKHYHLHLDSVMGYEAQIAGIGDCIPGQTLQNCAVPLLKRLSIPWLTKRRGDIVKALTHAGATLRFVNGGGTGSLPSTVADPAVTEVAVGSGFYSPHLFDYYKAFQYRPAAGFALEVVRQANKQYVTCAGGGYIASGGVGTEKLPRPHSPCGLLLDNSEGAGEVQTPLRGAVSQLKLGDPVLFRHAKAGELCERFNELLLIRNGQTEGSVSTYRGDGMSFL